MSKQKTKVSILLAIIFIFLLSITTYAQDANFGAAPILPANQNSDASYFDLRMKPDQEQIIEIIISNSDNIGANVEILISYATTNSNGLIIYSQTNKSQKDETLRYPMTEIASTDKNIVTVPPNGNIIVPIKIKMPKTEFDGTILGGIQLRKITPEEPEGQSVSINNEFAYVIGLVLSENDNSIKPELLLHSSKSVIEQNKVNFLVNMQNTKPKIMKDINLKAEFFLKGSNKILYSFENKYFSMAPNSNVDYEIAWENSKMKAGDYVVILTATKDDDVWRWSDQFTITKADEQAFINTMVEDTWKNNKALIVVIAVLILFIILLIIIIFIKKKRGEQR